MKILRAKDTVIFISTIYQITRCNLLWFIFFLTAIPKYKLKYKGLYSERLNIEGLFVFQIGQERGVEGRW